MQTVNLTAGVTLTGTVAGTTVTPSRNASVDLRRVTNYTAGDATAPVNQVLDKGTDTQTLAAGATVTVGLTAGGENPLGEAITGAAAFIKVREILVEHDSASLSSGVTVFNAASNSFQGMVSAAGFLTLPPGGRITLSLPTAAGMPVSGSAKNFKITNVDGVNAATIRYVVGGSIT